MSYDYYLAGPMRGYPEYNFPTFLKAANYIRQFGWSSVVSPAEHDLECGFDPTQQLEAQGFDLAASLKWDIQQVLDAKGIMLLPGWEHSEGATLEYSVAKATGKIIRAYDPGAEWGNRIGLLSSVVKAGPTPNPVIDSSESILEEAQRLIHGDRNAAYGHPLDDFQCTADFWTSYLRHKYDDLGPDVPELEPEDVGMMMTLLKISRQANAEKRDNLVDGAGYLGTVEMVLAERDRRAA